MEPSIKPNGFAPKSYGDLVAVGTLIAMMLSIVAWGLKLESRNDQLRDEIVEVKIQIGAGILPRADERIQSLEHNHNELESEYDQFVQWHRDNFVPNK